MSEENKNRVIKLLINQIRLAFPDEAQCIESRMQEQGWGEDEGLFTWVEQFSQCTTNAMKLGDNNKALSHLLFISNILNTADDTMLRCLDVYYVESLMWDLDEKGKQKGWALFPDNIKALYIDMWGERKWQY